MSSLAWIDFDEAERQRAQRIMALFQERETRDELGLGGIRDSIADHLFPGTSTIQTRLRYMLFVPWLFRMLEESTAESGQLEIEARGLENRLANALKAGGESNGVIGRDAGADLQRLPSSVYWAGLGTWGIRLFTGSRDNFLSCLPRLRNRSWQARDDEDVAAETHARQIWTPSLPCPPEGLLGMVQFRLRSEEAGFIIDRLISAQPRSLLTFLACSGAGSADCANIWEHPHLADFPVKTRTLVAHGEVFSSVMHGAALLYNLLLSRLRQNPDWIEKYESRLQEWREGLDMSEIRAWPLDSFWQDIDHPAHRIRPAAKRFVTEWVALVRTGEVVDGSLIAAARMVEDRERRLKKSQSRFSNRAVRDRWNGASGVEPLSFRWAQARSHLRDLADAG